MQLQKCMNRDAGMDCRVFKQSALDIPPYSSDFQTPFGRNLRPSQARWDVQFLQHVLGPLWGVFPILISHFIMPARPFKVRITDPMLKSRQLAFYNIKNKNHVKRCCSGGYVLMCVALDLVSY